jgi:hypothetical protein
MELILRLKHNAHSIKDARTQSRTVGLGIFPAASLLNHSCLPNCVYHFINEGRTIVFHALRPIAAGEEVCYAYVPLYQPFDTRCRLLEDAFHFSPPALTGEAAQRNELFSAVADERQQRQRRQHEERAREWLERTLQLLLQEGNPLAALRCANDWLVGENGASTAAAAGAAAAAQLHPFHQIRFDGYMAAVAAASKVITSSSDGGGGGGSNKGRANRRKVKSGNKKEEANEEQEQEEEMEEDATKLYALHARARFSMHAIQAMEATVPVGTPQLAALYATHGSSVLQLALAERRRGKQQEEQAVQMAKQSAAALTAAHRIRAVCFGEEHPIALDTERQLQRALTFGS